MTFQQSQRKGKTTMLATLALLFLTQAAPVTATTTQTPMLTGPASIEGGRQLALRNCAICHAIGQRGVSSNPAAPKFRHLARKYPIENLSEAFAEGILVGHSVMPEFEFAPDQVEGLVAYLKSIQVPAQRLPGHRPRKKR
jgi:cytochrome c